MKSERFGIRLNAAQRVSLDALAQVGGITRSAVIRRFLDGSLPDDAFSKLTPLDKMAIAVAEMQGKLAAGQDVGSWKPTQPGVPVAGQGGVSRPVPDEST